MESKAFGGLPERMEYRENYFSNYITHMYYLPGFLHSVKRKACFNPNFCVKKKWPTPSFSVGGESPPAFFHWQNLGTLLSHSLFKGLWGFPLYLWSQKMWSQTGKCFPSLDGLAIVIWTPLKMGTWSSYLCHCLTFPVKFCSLSFCSFLWLCWAFRQAPVGKKAEPPCQGLELTEECTDSFPALPQRRFQGMEEQQFAYVLQESLSKITQ